MQPVCTKPGVLKLFIVRESFNCQINSTDPFTTDLFHQHYFKPYNTIMTIMTSLTRAVYFTNFPLLSPREVQDDVIYCPTCF